MVFQLSMQKAFVLLTATLVAWSCAESFHAWTIVPNPVESNTWLATWPGVNGLMMIRAANASTVTNELTVSQLASMGHDRMTGLAVWNDVEFNTQTTLVYVNAYDDHHVWRYQMDIKTGVIKGQLQMQSPNLPIGLSLSRDGDTICVTGTNALNQARIVQCYRITRSLDDDGVTINEWWVMTSNFQWNPTTTSTSTTLTSESVLFDANALPTEASRRGSLWIDTRKSNSLVRFPFASLSGAYMPSFVALPSNTNQDRVAWSTENHNTQIIADPVQIYTINWNGNAPELTIASRPYDALTLNDYLMAIVWRFSSLDSFDRVQFHTTTGFSVTIPIQRTADAISIGEIAPSPTPMPTSSAMPSVSVTATVTPVPSRLPTVPIIENTTGVEISDNDNSHKHSPDYSGLWALVTLVLPCLCIPIVLVLVWKKRRLFAHANRLTVNVMWPGNHVQSMPLDVQSETDDSPGWNPLYDQRMAKCIAIPTGNENSPFQLGTTKNY